MDKYERYNPDEETIEAWLKGFEIRLLFNNITAADHKRNWCRALVGDTGKSVIERLPQAATWVEIKEELCSVLGDDEPKKRAFEILSPYRPRGRGLGEMAFDIMAKAAIATNDADLQTQLGFKALLQDVPESIGQRAASEAFRIGLGSLGRGTLPPVCMEEDEARRTVARFSQSRRRSSLWKSQRLNSTKWWKACMKQLQALQAQQKAKRAAEICSRRG